MLEDAVTAQTHTHTYCMRELLSQSSNDRKWLQRCDPQISGCRRIFRYLHPADPALTETCVVYSNGVELHSLTQRSVFVAEVGNG